MPRHGSGSNVPTPRSTREALKCGLLVPYHDGELVEPRLGSVRASLWTAATSNDALVQKLMHFYFLCIYPSFPFFSKDAFLDDVARGSHEHCSSLLVNCVLASASQGLARNDTWLHAGDDSDMPDRFLAEARRLWATERQHVTLTTVQAGCILSQLASGDGTDEAMLTYAIETGSLAQALGLFATYSRSVSQSEKIARAITAWSFFRWQALACFHCSCAPILGVSPAESLPSYDHAALYYGELRIKYLHTPTPFRVDLGPTILAGFQLSITLNELVKLSSQALGTGDWDLEQVLHYHRLLENWFNQLPDDLAQDHVVFPHHLKVHMYYYDIVLNLFTRLLASPNENGNSNIAVASRQIVHVSRIAEDARLKLETVLRLYYLHYGFELWDFFMVKLLAVLAYALVNKMNGVAESAATRHELCSSLVLCVSNLPAQLAILEPLLGMRSIAANPCAISLQLTGLRDQSRNYRLAESLYPVILSSMELEEASYIYSLVPVTSVEMIRS